MCVGGGCGDQIQGSIRSQSSVWESWLSLVLPFPGDYTNRRGGEMVWEGSPAVVCLDFASASPQGTYSNASVNWFLSPKLSWDPQLTSLFNKFSSSPAWPLSLLRLAVVCFPFVAHPRTCFLPPALGFLKTQGLFKAQLTFFFLHPKKPDLGSNWLGLCFWAWSLYRPDSKANSIQHACSLGFRRIWQLKLENSGRLKF